MFVFREQRQLLQLTLLLVSSVSSGGRLVFVLCTFLNFQAPSISIAIVTAQSQDAKENERGRRPQSDMPRKKAILGKKEKKNVVSEAKKIKRFA